MPFSLTDREIDPRVAVEQRLGVDVHERNVNTPPVTERTEASGAVQNTRLVAHLREKKSALHEQRAWQSTLS